MINIKNVTLKHQIKLTTPQSYEYDSPTQSVVLLKGYLYTVYYSNDSKEYQEVVDLRGVTENVPS